MPVLPGDGLCSPINPVPLAGCHILDTGVRPWYKVDGFPQ